METNKQNLIQCHVDVAFKVKNSTTYNSFNFMSFVCHLSYYEEDKSETYDGTGEKNEIDDMANTEALVEEKKSEDDTNDSNGEKTLTQEIDNDSNDNENLQGSSKSLMSTEAEKPDGGPEEDVDENDEDTGNKRVSEEENALENSESDDNKEDMITNNLEENINDAEEDTHYANMNGDDYGEDRSDGHKDADIETLMLNELQVHPDQEPDNPFPAEDWDTFV